MSPGQQRLKIAEACGWYVVMPPAEDGIEAYSLRHPTETTLYPWHPTKEECFSEDAPDYLTDLNAMRQAWLQLERRQQELATVWLWVLITGQTELPNKMFEMRPWMASRLILTELSHYAEAFLRTLNLWEESV